MIFKKIMQDIVCYSETTERIADTISYLFCRKKVRIKDEYYTTYKRIMGSDIGIIQPNFFCDTYMFTPKGKNYSYVVGREEIEEIN